jgi:predicted dehydrogenase
MMKRLQVGFLGAGYMGQMHASLVAGLPGVRLAAACSVPVDGALAIAAIDPAAGTAVYSDFDVMLRQTPLDALFIAVPPFAHSGQFEQAAKRGVHVFIEKPIALDAKRGVRMARAAQAAGIVTQVGYHMRYGVAVRKLKQLIDTGAAGTPTLMDARYDCNSLHGPWWMDRDKSGGQVLEQIIHLYDLARHFLGEPSAVSGFVANLCHGDVKGYTVEDTSAVSLRFQGGALANISGSNCAVPMEWNSAVTVVCRNVTVHFASPNKAEFIFTGGKSVKRVLVEGDTNPYALEDREFLKAVRENRQAAPSIEDGLRSLQMVRGALASSARNGAVVRL